MGKKSSDAPAPDPRMYDIMAQQVGLSKDALEFVKTAYGENIDRLKALDESQLRINDSLLSDAATARERSAENYRYYMDNYRPVEGQVIKDAQTIDSASNIDRVRGSALADVQQQAGMAQQASNRSMARYGLTPNATRMAAINSQLAAQTAAAGAGAMQNAEQGQRDRGYAMRTNVANIGRGYPAQSLAWTQSAQGAGQTALGYVAEDNESVIDVPACPLARPEINALLGRLRADGAFMTRLRQPERRVLDTLVDAGVARSRSEALAWCVKLVGEHTEQWLADLRTAMTAVDELRATGPAI